MLVHFKGPAKMYQATARGHWRLGPGDASGRVKAALGTCWAQAAQNSGAAKKHDAKNGVQPDFSEGVDNVRLETSEQYENQWQKIAKALGDKKAGV